MRISVLINNYNYARYLDDCLQSVFTQTRQPTEIIVVDDGSTDDSLQKLEAYSHRIQLIAQQNQGQAVAMASAINQAQGDIVCFLDSDDQWAPEHLEHICDGFESPHSAQMVYTNLELFGKSTGLYGPENFRFTKDVFIPRSQQLAFCNAFVGAPTSSIALQTTYAKELFASDKISSLASISGKANADEILVYGSSLLGCSKLARVEATARYRIHDNNHFYGRNATQQERRDDSKRKSQTIQLLASQHSIRPDINALQAELVDNLQRFPHGHPYARAYLKAPRKLGSTGLNKLYWKIKFRHLYNKAKRKP